MRLRGTVGDTRAIDLHCLRRRRRFRMYLSSKRGREGRRLEPEWMARDGLHRKPSNPYFFHSKLSRFSFEKVLRRFVDDISATTTALQTQVSVRSVNEIFEMLRERIEEEIGVVEST